MHLFAWLIWLGYTDLNFFSISIVNKIYTKIKKGTTRGSTILRTYDYTTGGCFRQLEDNINVKTNRKIKSRTK